ncbi:MAG TPA: VWA domain-containing protein [Pyrinomonadaceae bacterium]|nr:VWA domain-containing protein [Pyrinomonadaceae bacterium]
MNRIRLSLLIGLIALLSYSTSLFAQEQTADTVRINTRAVFLDALVRDHRTGLPVTDLHPENFEVLDNGQPRAVSYFTREGQSRKPLALVLVLDLRSDGSGRYLRRTEILEAIAAEIAKLPSGDEVGVIALDSDSPTPQRIWLTGFTGDRAQLKAALSSVPDLIQNGAHRESASSSQNPNSNNQGRMSVSVGSSSTNQSSAQDAPADDGARVTTIPSRNGAQVIRREMPDGTATIQRISHNGRVDVDLDDDQVGLTMTIQDIIKRASSERPNAQPAIIWISDGIIPVIVEERDEAEDLLLRSNTLFSSLNTDVKTTIKIFLPFVKPLTNWVGMSLYGSAQRLAKQTGGEAVSVHSPSDYGRGLSRIVGNLTARYNLGFTLAESEQTDGSMHQLEVRVRAQDVRGKTRRLDVTSRRGYFMPRNATETAER